MRRTLQPKNFYEYADRVSEGSRTVVSAHSGMRSTDTVSEI